MATVLAATTMRALLSVGRALLLSTAPSGKRGQSAPVLHADCRQSFAASETATACADLHCCLARVPSLPVEVVASCHLLMLPPPPPTPPQTQTQTQTQTMMRCSMQLQLQLSVWTLTAVASRRSPPQTCLVTIVGSPSGCLTPQPCGPCCSGSCRSMPFCKTPRDSSWMSGAAQSVWPHAARFL